MVWEGLGWPEMVKKAPGWPIVWEKMIWIARNGLGIWGLGSLGFGKNLRRQFMATWKPYLEASRPLDFGVLDFGF